MRNTEHYHLFANKVQRKSRLCHNQADPREAASAQERRHMLVYVPMTQPAGLAQSESWADVASRVPIHLPCYPQARKRKQARRRTHSQPAAPSRPKPIPVVQRKAEARAKAKARAGTTTYPSCAVQGKGRGKSQSRNRNLSLLCCARQGQVQRQCEFILNSF